MMSSSINKKDTLPADVVIEMSELTGTIVKDEPATADVILDVGEERNYENTEEVILREKSISNYTNTGNCDCGECLMCAVKSKHSDRAKSLLSDVNVNVNVKDNCGSSLLLIACANNLPEIAHLLIEKGASCEDQDNLGWTPLMFACSNDLFSVAEKLLGKKENSKNHINMKTKLPDTDSREEKSPSITTRKSPLIGFFQGKKEKLSNFKLPFMDSKSSSKHLFTALDCAIKANSKECIQLLLKHGASLYDEADDSKKMLPIKAHDFEIFLDSQIEFVDNTGEDSLKGKFNECLKLNYTFLESKSKNETKLLHSVINLTPDHKPLVKHPLVQAFLLMKWKKIRWIWLIWIVMKVAFFVLLLSLSWTMYGFTPNNCQTKNQTFSRKNTTSEMTSMNNSSRNTTNDVDETEYAENSTNYWFFLLFWIVFVIIELLQFFANVRFWIDEKKNWLQTLILSMTGILLFTMNQEEYCNTNRHLFAFLFPMTYLEFLCELGYNPSMKKYISVFYGVLRAFIAYFAVYGLFLLTFALGFFFMLPAGEENKITGELGYPDDGWMLLPKIMVMFIGEQEFMEIPLLGGNFRIFEVAFFLIFLLLMVVILMNLLNALAVKDAGEMLDSAEMDKLSSLLDTATFWERLLEDKKDSSREEQNLKESSGEKQNGRESSGEGQNAGESFREEQNVNVKETKLCFYYFGVLIGLCGLFPFILIFIIIFLPPYFCSVLCLCTFWWWTNKDSTLNYDMPKCIRSCIKLSILVDNKSEFFFKIFEKEKREYRGSNNIKCFPEDHKNHWKIKVAFFTLILFKKDSSREEQLTDFTISQEIVRACDDIVFKRSCYSNQNTTNSKDNNKIEKIKVTINLQEEIIKKNQLTINLQEEIIKKNQEIIKKTSSET